MKVEEQALTLCFSTPIWRLDFGGYEPVNAAIREELERLGWDTLDEQQRAIVHPSHSFREDRFVTADEVPVLLPPDELFRLYADLGVTPKKRVHAY